MEVYIEYVIIDNFVIDYIILFAVAKTLNIRCGKRHLSLGAGAGALLAVCLPLISVIDLVLYAIKFSTAAVMVLTIVRKPWKKYLLAYILFVTYTFVLGGAVIGIILFFNGDIYSAVTLNYNFSVPAGAIAGGGAFYIYLIIKLCKYVKRRINIYPFRREIELEYKGKSVKTSGFIDSGNMIYSAAGEPVTVISQKLAEKLLGQETVNNLILHICKDGEFEKKIFVSAAGKKSCIFLFKIDRLLIYSVDKVNIIENVPVGIVFSELAGTDGCEALLHSGQI